MHVSNSMKLSALTSAALLLSLGVSCQQPRMYCTTAHGHFGAKYTLTSNNKGDPCAQQTGDVLGMQTYFAPGGVNGTPKFHEPSVAIRAQYGGLVFQTAFDYPGELAGFDYDDLGPPNAVSDFKSGDPDGEDICFADDFKGGVIDVPAFPEIPPVEDDPATPDVDESDPGYPAEPAKLVKYEWSNAKWLVNPDAQGTQFEADLKFTEDGCVAEYKVSAVYPAIDCQSDEDCTADDSGINPGFAVECDLSINANGLDVEDDPMTPENEAENWGICVLKEKIPSYE